MKKLILILFLVAALFATAGSIYAQTADGTALNNVARVTANNVPAGAGDTHTTNVERIVSAMYTAIPTDASGAPGATVNLIFTVNNQGNAAGSFSINSVAVQETTNGSWTVSQLDNALGVDFPIGNTCDYTLQVVIGGAASNGSYMEFQIGLISDELGSAVRSGAYRGDNGTDYCGDMGIPIGGASTNALDGLLQHDQSLEGGAAGNLWVRVTVSGPDLRISKEIDQILLGGVAAPGVVPGATITYSVRVSNVGSGVADNVIISDVIPAATTYAAGTVAIAGYDVGNWTIGEHTSGVITATNSVNGLNTTNGGGNNGWVDLTFDVTVD